jgi:MFS family permease
MKTESSTSAWSPLRHRIFLALWLALTASNIGTWFHEVAAAWLMTELAPRPLMVSLVKASLTLPMLILVLPAGALADVVDRRKLLLGAQSWMLLAAGTLAGLAAAGQVTPWILLGLTFALGLGNAMVAPAGQAIIPELVPTAELSQAMTLRGIGINVARALGPALGGYIVGQFGVSIAFTLNSVSFAGVIGVLWFWDREVTESVLPGERIIGAMRTGLRYAGNSPELRAVLVRGAAFIFFGSALWALLPLVAKRIYQQPATGYGIMLGSIGMGALVGGAILPSIRSKISADNLVSGAVILYGAVAASLPFFPAFWMSCLTLVIAGLGWLTILATLNAAAVGSVPDWVRARAVAIYNLIFFGGMGLGSIAWGLVAETFGVPITLVVIAVGMILGLFSHFLVTIRSPETMDWSPSYHWANPGTAELTKSDDRGPVLVTVEYLIDQNRCDEFLNEILNLKPVRLRSGASRWYVFQDPEQERRFVEIFVVESWVEHMRQHERVTEEDRRIQNRVDSFHVGDGEPEVSHLISPAK